MWISQRNKGQESQDGVAQMGTVTIGGNPASVYWDGERRNLPIIAPMGYRWAPMTGDQVLVIKSGDQGESPCVVGAQVSENMTPGAVQIVNGQKSASITLDENGNIWLVGTVFVNGEELVVV